MATQWLRRTWLLAAACATGLLVAGCGGGDIESQLNPNRIVAFGDAFADLGQTGTRYTVNDGTTNNWTQYVAEAFGKPLAPSAAGGLSFARAHVRVTAHPDATGNAATPTVQEQIAGFLANGAFAPNDLVIVNAGTSDIIVNGREALGGTLTRDQMLANAGQAGRELGAQVRRLVQAGAQHVVVVGPYNLGRSPWVRRTPGETLLEDASSRFNEQMLISIVDLGERVLYVDAALYFNLVTGNGPAYALENVDGIACTSVDPGVGIGIGPNAVNSGLCNNNTLQVAGAQNLWLFADAVYPTPRGHRLFGEYAYNRIRERW